MHQLLSIADKGFKVYIEDTTALISDSASLNSNISALVMPSTHVTLFLIFVDEHHSAEASAQYGSGAKTLKNNQLNKEGKLCD